MKMKTKIYAYFWCDEWKSRSSYALVGIFDEETLRKELLIDWDMKIIEFDNDSFPKCIDRIIRNVKYAEIEEICINEKLEN